MTTTVPDAADSTEERNALSARFVHAINARMIERGVSARQLATTMGVTTAYVEARLRSETPLLVVDIAMIDSALADPEEPGIWRWLFDYAKGGPVKPAAPAAARTCPSWCDVDIEGHGEHFAAGGTDRWPSVTPTSDPRFEPINVTATPGWCAVDGVKPDVALHLESRDLGPDGVGTTDVAVLLTPSEAILVAGQLVAAAEAAREVIV